MVVKPAPHILTQEVEGETVLLDTEQGNYFVLDDVGTRAWQLLVEHGDLAAVADIMLAEFEVDERTLRNDLGRLVDQLSESGLLVPSDPTP